MWTPERSPQPCRRVTPFNTRFVADAGPFPVFQRRSALDSFVRENADGERESTNERSIIAVEPLTSSITAHGETIITIDRLDVQFIRWVNGRAIYDGVIYHVSPMVFIEGKETPVLIQRYDDLVEATVIPKLASLERRMRNHCYPLA